MSIQGVDNDFIRKFDRYPFQDVGNGKRWPYYSKYRPILGDRK